MTLTRDEFNQQCVKFVKRCRELNEQWYLFSKSEQTDLIEETLESLKLDNQNEITLMLEKKVIRRDKDGKIRSYVYNVIYSESFEVPVMYFDICNQDGSQLGPNEILSLLMETCPEDSASVISQVEHPLSYLPVYMVHPCRTRDFMQVSRLSDKDDYLICWLSTVGTLLKLEFDLRLGHDKVDTN